MYALDFKESDLSEMNITTPGYFLFDNPNDIIADQAKRGEAFTLHINDKKCAVIGFLDYVFPNSILIWMAVDEYIRESIRNKIKFLRMCIGMERYAKLKYNGLDFYGFTESNDKIYHEFLTRFGFYIISKSEHGYIYKRRK